MLVSRPQTESLICPSAAKFSFAKIHKKYDITDFQLVSIC